MSGKGARSSELSTKEQKILRVLKKNARSTIRQISKKTGIRPSTVHQRLTKMMKDGTIRRFTIDIDEERLGIGLTVFMLISGSLDKYMDKEILKDRNLVEISGITGEYDLLLKLKFKSMAEFNTFIIRFRERYADKIHNTVTMVQTINLKDDSALL
jgi:DNA-binding Lrp family transcriptional regulator